MHSSTVEHIILFYRRWLHTGWSQWAQGSDQEAIQRKGRERYGALSHSKDQPVLRPDYRRWEYRTGGAVMRRIEWERKDDMDQVGADAPPPPPNIHTHTCAFSLSLINEYCIAGLQLKDSLVGHRMAEARGKYNFRAACGYAGM